MGFYFYFIKTAVTANLFHLYCYFIAGFLKHFDLFKMCYMNTVWLIDWWRSVISRATPSKNNLIQRYQTERCVFIVSSDWRCQYHSAHLTPESSALRMAESCSVKSGSTLVWMETSWPRASAALSRTARLESCRAFRKVVCSWGRKGFRAMPTWRREPHDWYND